MNKRTKTCVMVVLAAIVVSGCSPVINPQARAKMEELNEDIKRMTASGMESIQKVEAIATEIGKIKAEVQAGQLDAAKVAEASVRMQALIAEGSQFYQRYEQARVDVGKAQVQIRALQQEHGVPAWQIGLNAGLAVLSTLAGSQWLRSRAGLQVLTSAIENGADVPDIKKRVAKHRHPHVEAAVRRTA